MKSIKYILAILAATIGFMFFCPVDVHAADNDVMLLDDGEFFSPSFYAEKYPDVKAALGTDPAVLANHYLLSGRYEGRDPISPDLVKNYIIVMTNQERTNAGLSALTEDAELTEIADTRALEEAPEKEIDHYRPDGSSLITAFQKNGKYITKLGGENLARYTTPKDVVGLWMNSAGHRANIMNPEFTKIGIGIAKVIVNQGSVKLTQYCYSQEFAK